MFRNLLNVSEHRRLKFIEILACEDTWLTLNELSGKLNVSSRVLKDDISYFRQHNDAFTIRTSYKGVRLQFKNNHCLKTIFQQTYAESRPYQLLETIFFNEEKSIDDLATEFFVSSSTLYRMVDKINKVFAKQDFSIQTNPCRVVGNEKNIRHFFYQYFYEKYLPFEWPYTSLNEETIDQFLKFFLDYTKMDTDFAYYHIFKTVSAVNLIRYQNENYINTEHIKSNFNEIIADLTLFSNKFKAFEEELNLQVNEELIQQIFTPFIQEEFSLNYKRLEDKAKTDKNLKEQVEFLENFLKNLPDKHEISLLNKKEIILTVHNQTYLQKQIIQPHYILYNQYKYFSDKVQKDFPDFYEDLYEGAKNYQKISELAGTKEDIDYIIYLIFTYWEHLISELRKKQKKIKALIVSDHHKSYSKMLKDFLTREFYMQLKLDIYTEIDLNVSILEQSDYDMIVTTFPVPPLRTKPLVYIQNVPNFKDVTNIQYEIDKIISNRNKNT